MASSETSEDDDDDELLMMRKYRKHIHRNLSSLIELTKLDAFTMAKIKERDILGSGDMEAVECKINRHDRNSEFYGRIVSRLGFFNVLLELMETTQQTEVLRILKKFDEPEVVQGKKYQKLPKSLQQFLDNKSSKFCVLQTLDNQITCEKLRENLKKRCSIKDEKTFLELISSSSNLLPKEIVHVVKDSTIKNMRHLMVNLMSDKQSVAKLVLISSETVEKLEEFVGRNPSWGRSVELLRDSMEWEDMTLSKQCEMRAKLEEFFGTEFEEEEKLSRLSGQLLVDLINEKELNELKLFKQTLPAELSYYVERKMLWRNSISMKIFELGSSGSDVFLFAGMKRNELSRFAKSQRTDSSRSQIHQDELSVRYMTLDHPNHFDKICRKTNRPVHWLRYEEGGKLMRWIRSRGNLNMVQKCVDKLQLAEGEEEFCLKLKSSLPVCISDSPGMGKSVLLAQIGRRLKAHHPDRLVLFIVLGEFIHKVKAKLATVVEETLLLEATRSALAETVCENVIGESVLKSRLEGGNPKSEEETETILVELLLDGFDEVDTADLKLAFDLIQTIKSTWKTCRLWITSRPHFLEALENNLGQLGFTIQPFCEHDQIQFLSTFWSQQEGASLDRDRSCQFAKACLASLKTTVNSKDEDIAGTPLQCLLLGEVYKEDALEYADNANTDANNNMPLHIDIRTITNLYRGLIKNKFEKYRTAYGSPKLSEEEAMSMLAKLGLELVFPEHFQKLEHLFEQQVDELEEVLKIGILEETSTPNFSNSPAAPKFIHRTFAEYFVAWFVVQRLTRQGGWNSDISGFFWNELVKRQLIYGFAHPVICYFLNALLDHSSLHSIELIGQNFVIGVNLPAQHIREIAEAAVHDDFPNIFKLFHKCTPFEPYYSRYIFDKAFLCLAIGQSSLPLVRLVVLNFERHYQLEQSPDIQVELLHRAVQRADFSIVDFLMKEKGLCLVVAAAQGRVPFREQGLLHSCVQLTSDMAEPEVEQKMEILGLLVNCSQKLLEELDNFGRSPLLTFSVHVRLLIKLVELGADVAARYGNNMTVFHLAGERAHLSAGEYNSLLRSIPERKRRHIVAAAASREPTPLKSVLRLFDPLEETLDLLHTAGDDFNCFVQGRNYTLLEYAIRRNRSPGTLRKLVDFGADAVGWRDQETGKSYLHLVAELGSFAAVNLFIELGIDVNVRDKLGLTPLDYAVQSEFCSRGRSRFETGIRLHEKGGRLMLNAEGQSLLLHVSAKKGNLESVRLLLHIGVEEEVNLADLQGNTPLHLATEVGEDNKDYASIATVLIEHGANVNALNHLGETPFRKALDNDKLDVETFQLLKYKTERRLVEHHSTLILKSALSMSEDMGDDEFNSLFQECLDGGADIHYKDEMGNSFLHLAAQSELYKSVSSLMSTKRVDVNLKNDKEETALHIAVQGVDPDNRPKIIKYLVEQGADLRALNHLGESPIETALKNERLDLKSFQLLKNMMTMKQAQACTLLILKSALRMWNELGVKELSSLFQECLDLGTDLSYRDDQRNSLLHLAAQLGLYEPLRTLLSSSLSSKRLDVVNWTNCKKETVLHKAAQGRDEDLRLKIIKYLIEHGADVSAKDSQNRTFLHHYKAVTLGRYFKYYPIIDYLVEMKYSHLLLSNVEGEDQDSPIRQSMLCILALDKLLELDQSKFLSELKQRWHWHWEDLVERGRKLFYAGPNENDVDDEFRSVIQADQSSISLLEKCKLLIENGADKVVPKDKDGPTTLITRALQRYNGPDKEELVWLLGNP